MAADAPPTRPIIAALHVFVKGTRNISDGDTNTKYVSRSERRRNSFCLILFFFAKMSIRIDDMYYVQQFGRQRHRAPVTGPLPVVFDVHDDLNELPCVSVSVWSSSNYSADNVSLASSNLFFCVLEHQR